jgi:predicted Zn-dependent protease
MKNVRRITALLVLILFPCNLLALTLSDEKKYGRQVFVEMSKSAGFVSDPYVSIYMDMVKKRLESAADLPLPVSLTIIDSDTLDAFATVGGYVFITTGILAQCDREDEIAGVLAHEFGHVGKRHVAQNADKQKFINWGMMAAMLLAMLAPSDGKAALMTTGMGAGQAMALKYTREFEEEADRVGLATVEKAGYSGLGTATFLKKLRAAGLEKSVPQYLLTHPYSDQRIARIEQAAMSPASKVDSSLFPFLVVRVKILDNPLTNQTEDIWMKKHEKEPEDPISAYGAALVCSLKGKTNQAEAILRRIASPYRALFLGEFFVGSNRPKEAVEVLRNESNPVARYYLGKAYEMQGELRTAASIYSGLLSHAGTYPELYQRAGMVFGRMKDEGRGYENLGRYYLATGKDKQAKMNLEKAVSKYGINSKEAKGVLELLEGLEPRDKNKSGGTG